MRDAAASFARLPEELRALLEAYAAGINHYFSTRMRPWELLLVGYSPAEHPWTAQDTLVFLKLMSYMGLASGDGDMEKIVVLWAKHEGSAGAF